MKTLKFMIAFAVLTVGIVFSLNIMGMIGKELAIEFSQKALIVILIIGATISVSSVLLKGSKKDQDKDGPGGSSGGGTTGPG